MDNEVSLFTVKNSKNRKFFGSRVAIECLLRLSCSAALELPCMCYDFLELNYFPFSTFCGKN